MESRALLFDNSELSDSDDLEPAPPRPTPKPLTVKQLKSGIDAWLIETEYNDRSPDTLAARKYITSKLIWFTRDREYTHVGTPELKAFFVYLQKGHEDDSGRWGNGDVAAQATRSARKPARGTIATYHANLRTMFRWLLKEAYITASPMESMEKPRVPKNQIQPFTNEQAQAIIDATKKTDHPKRNKAIALLWLDTGMRVDELCKLRMRDLDLHGRNVTVLGKGQKTRRIPVSAETTRAILHHLNEDGERDLHEPVFRSERGTQIGGHLTPSGALRLAHRLGEIAGISAAVRCSPHTFRHSFAVMFLRNGGNVFTLKELLGHTSLTICQRYVSLAQADIEHQHRQFSPVQALRKK